MRPRATKIALAASATCRQERAVAVSGPRGNTEALRRATQRLAGAGGCGRHHSERLVLPGAIGADQEPASALTTGLATNGLTTTRIAKGDGRW